MAAGGARPGAGRKTEGRKTVSFRIAPEAYEWLKQEGAKNNESTGQVIERLINIKKNEESI